MATMIYNGMKRVGRWCISCQEWRLHRQAYSTYTCCKCGRKS